MREGFNEDRSGFHVTVQLHGVKEGKEVGNPMELGFGGESSLC